MTGIAAIFADGPARTAQLEQMMAAMDVRVRDHSGIWAKAPFAMGALVLHTTSESFDASQPATNEDASLALVMDGYLTNWEELRRDLAERGALLRDRSDAELVLRAYERWGEACANRLEGEFAIVIADARKGRIFAIRDHQGLRPLYIYADVDALLIASDMAAIIAACTRKPAPNLDYLACIAAGHWYQRDATVWQGVERVPQSHWLTFDGQTRTVQRYYTVPETVTLHYRREEEYIEHYRDVLFDAVRRTARSHRPLAITVSGGLDSSSIYCIADRLEREGRLPAPGLQGYTLAGEPGTGAYELPYARAAAEHCGRSLIEVPLFRPGIEWFTARGRADCDVPIPQNAAMLLGLEQRAHSEGARALVNGIGGDQWLDGTHEYYSEFARAFDLGGFATGMIRDVRAQGWRSTLPLAMWFGASGFAPLALRRVIRRRRRERRYRNPADLFWMRPHWREKLLEFEHQFYAQLPEEPRGLGNWNRVWSPYQAFALDVMQRQRARNGLEAREPMQTRQFIEFCASAPKWLFLQGGVTRAVHRKAMRGILPRKIIERHTKAEFSAPHLTAAFAQFAYGAGCGALDPLCDGDGLTRATGAGAALMIDPDRRWEVWGLYVAAAFLLCADETVSRVSGKTGADYG